MTNLTSSPSGEASKYCTLQKDPVGFSPLKPGVNTKYYKMEKENIQGFYSVRYQPSGQNQRLILYLE